MTTPSARELLLGTPFSLATMATAVLDQRGIVIGWNTAAEKLYGHTADDALGKPARKFFVPIDGRPLFDPDSPAESWGETRTMRGRGGSLVRTVLYVLQLGPKGANAAWAIISIAADQMERWATDQAILAGLFTQAPIALTVYGPDSRVNWVNNALEGQTGLALHEWVGRYIQDILPEGEIISPELWGRRLESVIEQVFRTGEPVVDLHYRSPTPAGPTHQRVWSCSYFRLQDAEGHCLGVCESAFTITERYETQRRLTLLSRSSSIGGTLDVTRTSEELVAVVVPDFADAAWVDLAEPVLTGEEPAPWHASQQLRRVTQGNTPGQAAATPPLVNLPAGDQQLVLPLKAGGATLGLVTLLRSPPRAPFNDADRALAEELVAHTAVCLDNARRYAHEHAAALLLQHSLLPQELPEPTAVETAHYYAPTAGPTGVGGDWYDVIPLSGARVGLAVGDVVGHGLHAAVTMGRLRTTVRALAALDLAPDELLTRLDDLVGQAGMGIHPAGESSADQAVCARCLYAVYDPVSRRCSVASAGHLPPVLAAPDEPAIPLDIPVGPPLGIGGLPFECAEFDIAENSMLALFTDGLVADTQHDFDAGVAGLCRILSRYPELSPADVRDRIVESKIPADAQDDVALLLVRVHSLADDNMASWRIDPDPAQVARARASAMVQLARWDLSAVSFVVELIVSELVTNAIRYGSPPLHLRLLRDQDRALICEVSDGSHTSPHLQRARLDEEGGRGLFLVAQLTDQWGTRYTREGKTIWTEVPIRLGVVAGGDALSA